MTRAEVLLWQKLRGAALGVAFRRQHPIGPYIADFACVAAKVVVEVDGATHATSEEIGHDRVRTAYLERGGWRVVRVWNREVVDNIEGVLDTIRRAVWEQEEWLSNLESS